MPSLKELRTRRRSVISTKKITSAMKLVAAAKLKRVQDKVSIGRNYARQVEELLSSVLVNEQGIYPLPELLVGRKTQASCVLVVVTANRGLCGSLNSLVIKEAKRYIANSLKQGIPVRVFCLGRKGYDNLRRGIPPSSIVGFLSLPESPMYAEALALARELLNLFKSGACDKCLVVYSRFVSIISQKVILSQLVPFEPNFTGLLISGLQEEVNLLSSPYDYEPSKDKVLTELLTKNLAAQVYQIMIEGTASEQGARMTSMDAATRNAEEMIKSLGLVYNRERQSSITKELIELISSAEVVELKH